MTAPVTEGRWILWVNSVPHLFPPRADEVPTMNEVKTMWEDFLGRKPLGPMDSDIRVSRTLLVKPLDAE